MLDKMMERLLVLILVLMEDTLREVMLITCLCSTMVLILVLMEDTLRAFSSSDTKVVFGLNPCFNGRYSQRLNDGAVYQPSGSLNPCFNGRYSQSW